MTIRTADGWSAEPKHDSARTRRDPTTRRLRAAMLLVILGLLLASCAPSNGARTATQPGAGEAPRAPQRSLVLALAWEPDILEPSRLQVSRESAPLTNAFLTLMTPQQEAQ